MNRAKSHEKTDNALLQAEKIFFSGDKCFLSFKSFLSVSNFLISDNSLTFVYPSPRKHVTPPELKKLAEKSKLNCFR